MTQRQLPLIAMAPGRNDPCPCGSKKKYKRCCGLTGQPSGSRTVRQIDTTAAAKRALLEGEQQVIVNELLSGGTYVDPRGVVGVTSDGFKVASDDYSERLRRQERGVKVLSKTEDVEAIMLIHAAEQGDVERVQHWLQKGVPVGARPGSYAVITQACIRCMV